MILLVHGVRGDSARSNVEYTYVHLQGEVVQCLLPSLFGYIVRKRVPPALVAVVPSTVLKLMGIDAWRHRGRAHGIALAIVSFLISSVTNYFNITVDDKLEFIGRLPTENRGLWCYDEG